MILAIITIVGNPSLLDYLTHLAELADSNLSDSHEFDIAHDSYIRAAISEENADQIKKCIAFLATRDHIGKLNIANMTELLENKIVTTVA